MKRFGTIALIVALAILVIGLTIGGSVVVEKTKGKIEECENNSTDIDFSGEIVYHDIKFKKETSHGR